MSLRMRNLLAITLMVAVMTALVAASVFAAPGRGKGQGPFTQLNLSDSQKSRIDAIMADHRATMQQLNQSNATPKQKMAKRAELRKDMMSQVNEVLTPDQRAKLKNMRQDRRQDRREDIRDCMVQLNLSKDQKARIQETRKNTQSKVQAVRANKDLTEQQKGARIMEIRKNSRQKMVCVLSPTQREELRKCEASKGPGKGPRAGYRN